MNEAVREELLLQDQTIVFRERQAVEFAFVLDHDLASSGEERSRIDDAGRHGRNFEGDRRVQTAQRIKLDRRAGKGRCGEERGEGSGFLHAGDSLV
jgi:hypothetical protein